MTTSAKFTVVCRPDGRRWWRRSGRRRDGEQLYFYGFLKGTRKSRRGIKRHSILTNAILVIASPSAQNQTLAHLWAKQSVACCIARGTTSSSDARARLILFRRALLDDSRIRLQARTTNLCTYTDQYQRMMNGDQTCTLRFFSTP